MQGHHLLKNKFKIKELSLKTCDQLLKETKYDKTSTGCDGIVALVLANRKFPGQEILTKTHAIIQKNLYDFIFKKDLSTYIVRQEMKHSSDIISNLKFELKSIDGVDLNHLLVEIKILIGQQVVFKSQNAYEGEIVQLSNTDLTQSNPIQFDCIIPLISAQYAAVYVDVIFSEEIIYYSDAIFNFQYTKNYLGTCSRRFLAQNGYVFSDQIHLKDGTLRKKITLHSSDCDKLNKIFQSLDNTFVHDPDDEKNFLGELKHLYHYDKYFFLLSEKKIPPSSGFLDECENSFNSSFYNLNNSGIYLKFQLFNIDGDQQHFNSYLTEFSYDSINLLSNNTQIIIKTQLREFTGTHLNYKLKSYSKNTLLYLKMIHFYRPIVESPQESSF